MKPIDTRSIYETIDERTLEAVHSALPQRNTRRNAKRFLRWIAWLLRTSVVAAVLLVPVEASAAGCPCGPCQGEKPLRDAEAQAILDRFDARIHAQHDDGFWASFLGWWSDFLMSSS